MEEENLKKIIYFLLIVISMFSFSILFNNQKLQVNSDMEKAEQSISNSYNIVIPSDILNSKESDIYNCIVEVLKKHNANIYYSKIGPNERIIKFVYLTDLSYFNNFEITEGRSLNSDEIESNKFLNSENTGDENQIGRIATFDGKQLFEIRTLKSMLGGNYLLDGNCTVQLSNGDNIDSFIKDLESSLNTTGIQNETKNTITPEYYYNQWIIPSLYFIIILLILYSILKSYKKFGIQKMLGYSIKGIWIKEVLSLIISQAIITIVVDIAMSLFLFKEFNIYLLNFLKILFINNISQVGILFVISSIPFIYLNNITVINIIKNKIPIKDIIIFNSILKVILIILFFNLINQGIQNYNRIENTFTNRYKSWEDTKGYYILPYINTKNGDMPIDKSAAMLTQLYFNVNEDGAIWANFSNYSPAQYKMNSEVTNYDYERDWVTVNPNYLKSNLIYDVNNQPIAISEDDADLVLLVPDKYKENEKDIINLWEKMKLGYAENEMTRNEKIKIIYTKSNQKIFSYESDVNPDDGNMVTDSIVRVITEKNGVDWDYDITIGFGGNPIKIKVDPSFDPEKYIIMKLQEVGLEKYVDKIVPANDGVAFESKSVYELLIFIIGGLIILTIAMVIIILQNVYCFFEQYKLW